MIIDFHTHIFPDKIAKKSVDYLGEKANLVPDFDGTDFGLISEMIEGGVDIAVSLPVVTKPSQFESILEYALYINEKYKDSEKKIISFAGIHPACDDIKGKIKRIKTLGFKGIKIHPDYQDTFIDDDSYVEILKAAKDNDLIVVTHSGVDLGFLGLPVRCTPERAKRVIEMVKPEKFVLAHYGASDMWDEVYSILAGSSVFFDTSFTFNGIKKEMFLKILDKHGEDKILFATDCPWQNMRSNVKTLKEYVTEINTLDKILYKNALKLLSGD